MTISTEPTIDSALASTRLRRRRRRTRWVLAIVPIAAIWAALVAWSLVNANQDARAGLSKLEDVRADFTLDDLESGYVQTLLGDAASDFQTAQTHLRAPWVTPLRLVPFAGTQIRSADALSSSAAVTMKALEDGAERLLAIKGQAEDGSIGRAEAARRSSTTSANAVSALSTLELGPAAGLFPRLHTARADFQAELDDLLDALTRAEVATRGLADFLHGPSHFL